MPASLLAEISINPQFVGRVVICTSSGSVVIRRRMVLPVSDSPFLPRFFESTQNITSSNLQATIEHLEEERVQKFFEPINLARIGRRAHRPDFSAELADMIADPTAYSRRDKQKMLQFVSDAYNDHIGAPRTRVKLVKDKQDTLGYFRPGGRTVFVNEDHPNFFNDFGALIGTVVHENTHNGQDNPNVYGNPVLSRIYRDNFRNYRTPANDGYWAYRNQPVEAGAHAAGNMAQAMAYQLAGYRRRRRPCYAAAYNPYRYLAA